MTYTFSRRGRLAGAVLGIAALGGGTLGAVGLPAANAVPPTADCAVAYPTAEVVPGAPVDGLTVTQGTTPTTFTGEILGVITDGIAPGVDMVMAELSSPAITRAGGIWQGMSGSPVYAADGRLIGAVAYGLSYGPSPIAGITPFEDMKTYLPGATPRASVPVTSRQAEKIAARSDVNVRQARSGFSELPVQSVVSGISKRNLDRLQRTKRPYVTDGLAVAGRAAPAAAPGAETLEAGGNLAAAASYGDISFAGVGTVTSVCGGRVVGFGHPMYQLGRTTMAMLSASAVYVQPESLGAPFKVANIGQVVGTIDEDRLTGISGAFGAAPTSTRLESTVAFGSRKRTGTTDVYVPDATAEATLYQVANNHFTVLENTVPSTMLQTWTISGTERSGAPFTLSVTDRHSADEGVEMMAYSLADTVFSTLNVSGVRLKKVTSNSAVSTDKRRIRLARVEQRVKGRWVKVKMRQGIVGRAGKKVALRAVLKGAGGQRVHRFTVKLPRAAYRSSTAVVIGSGSPYFSGVSGFKSIKDARTQIRDYVRSDQLQIQFGTMDKVMPDYDEEEEEYYRPARVSPPKSFVRSQKTKPFSHIVDAGMYFPVTIVR